MINAEFHSKLAPLFEPFRYKVLYGGRAGLKSWGIARALLLIAAQTPKRILCVRELQASLDDSVHRLLSDQIYALGLQGFYTIEKASIRGANGSEFSFEGIRHNVQKIKSYEGIDICWVEEAQAVRKFSWEVLIPTIRKAGSEIWVSFNPFREKDDTYQRFIVNPQPNSVVIRMSWRDNQWLSPELLAEIEHARVNSPDDYLHIWEGHCVNNLEGAVYAAELRDARAQGRICVVPYDRTVGVIPAFDLGRRDFTAIWFMQKVALQWRAVDYYEMRGKDFAHYIEVLQKRPYVYDFAALPHDGDAKVLGAKHSIKEQLAAHGFRVKVVKRQPIITGISAVRSIFPSVWFDEKNCAPGIKRLEEYRFDVDPEDKEYSLNPVHDEASHGADAFRTFALALKANVPQGRVTRERAERLTQSASRFAARLMPAAFRNANTGWMR